MATKISTLLSSLNESLQSAATALPGEDGILPPKEGISLLDVKNELLLSYLQNLVFLILLKTRDRGMNGAAASRFVQEDVLKKLIELRVYLEKGVRPLEGKLKYQIDKVVRAAEDASRSATQKAVIQEQLTKRIRDEDVSGDESNSGHSEDSQIDELAYRPNPAAFGRPAPDASKTAEKSRKDGIYRPPRINATAMPAKAGREEKEQRRPAKSATLDEFIATELSTAPVAESSIGSTIVAGGRHTKSAKERAIEEERRVYEESNFVRLPNQSKKDRVKQRGGRQDGYGGEEWRNLGVGLDRIERLTQKKGGFNGALERSRKRPVQDGPRGDGTEMGQEFAKKRKMLINKSRRG